MQTSIITGYVDSIFYFLSSLSLYFLSYKYLYGYIAFFILHVALVRSQGK